MTAHLVSGSDPALVGRALDDLLAELGADAGSQEIEEFEPVDAGDDGRSRGSYDLGPVLQALATPPFLSERRVVVMRGAGAISTAQAGELVKAIAEPTTDNVLVLVSPSKDPPAALKKAVRASGGRTLATDAPRAAREKEGWLEERLRRGGVQLDAASRRRLLAHVGEEASLVDPIIDLARAVHGEGARLGESELEPLLGAEGDAPPWELTDAIDAGDGGTALRVLARMIGPGGRHPVQLIASLQRHASAMLRLDGADDVRSAAEAAAVLGMSPFPARKVFEQSRRLGHAAVARQVELIAEADADLRGRIAWPPELVMEVLVARLAQLSRTAGPSSRRQR